MSENQELINKILSDEKLRNSAKKVYSDEPLIFTASQMKNYTPPEYIKMKKIANLKNSNFRPATEIFYDQAKYMENFCDNFDYHGEFIHYFPTYLDMNIFQLRGYFSWRTDVRDGIINKTSLSFVFLYMYELINLIGVQSAEDAFYKLKAFTDAYKAINYRIEYYTNQWLKDLVIYYGLDLSLLKGHSDFKYDSALITLINYKTSSASDVLDALDLFSSYKIKHSAFYKKYPQDTADTIYRLFDILYIHYAKTGKNDIFNRLFGKKYKTEYFIFHSAVFYEKQNHADCTIDINSICRYICKNNSWFCESFICQKDKAGRLGALLKNTDFYLRKSYGFKSTLKSIETTDVFIKAIQKAILLCKEEKIRTSKPQINIDVSKLQNIRDISIVTRDKLIVDEKEDENNTINVSSCYELPVSSQEIQNGNNSSLDTVQLEVIQKLLKGESPEQSAKQNGVMLSVVIDTINDILFDSFGDTVIAFDNDKPYIIEDYEQELKGMFLK